MDGSWVKEGGMAAVGWVWPEGILQYSGIALPTLALSPLHAETLALYHASLWAAHNQWDRVECCTDSANLVELLIKYPLVSTPMIYLSFVS